MRLQTNSEFNMNMVQMIPIPTRSRLRLRLRLRFRGPLPKNNMDTRMVFTMGFIMVKPFKV